MQHSRSHMARRHSTSSETIWQGASAGHPVVAESWAVPAAANLKRPESRCGTWLPSSTALAIFAATIIAKTFGGSSFVGTGSDSWFANSKTQTENSTLCLSSFAAPTAAATLS